MIQRTISRPHIGRSGGGVLVKFASLIVVFFKKKHLNGALRVEGRSEADKSEGRGWSIDSGNYLVPSAWFSLRVADRAFRARRRPW